MKRIAHIQFVKAVVCAFLYFITPVYGDIPWLHVDGNNIKDPNDNVVVLRGVSLIDLSLLEVWQGGAINMIDRLTDKTNTQGNSPGWYPKVLRIPICPPDSVDGWPFRWYSNDDSFYNYLLRPIVDYCAQKDLYVILDWHYCADTWDKVEQTSEFWRYMAPRFANDSNVLFELFNEPVNLIGSDVDNWLSVRTDMQTWVDIVRSYAPYNLILVGGPVWSMGIGPAASYPVAGCNIAMVAHIYPGHWLGSNTEWHKNQIMTCAAVHPVIITEWGFTTTSDDTLLNGTISNYGRPLMDFIEGLKIGNTAWVASYDWGPPMFWNDWTLRCGEGQMGCFVKDTLYEKRNDDQPCGAVQLPTDWGCLSTEDFETNNFLKFFWEHGGDASWITSSHQRHSGRYSAESGEIENGQRSVLKVTLDCVSGDITFYRKVSSESGYDYLKFSIDGAAKDEWSGEQDWGQISFPVDEGTRTFEWTYSKDSSASEGDDAAWIDDIVFPRAIHIEPPEVTPPRNPETNGFDLYLDDIASGIGATSAQTGLLDYDCQDNPASGNYCIHWGGVGQYASIPFRFSPIKDLSVLVDEGFAVDFWVRCDEPSAKIDIGFVDTKTGDRTDHPWRMRYMIDQNVARWDGQWNHLQIPLDTFFEQGSWDDDRWYGPIGAFDWTATEYFEIIAEYGDLIGIHFYFDDIRVVRPNPPTDLKKACDPYPSDGAQFISPDVTLNWAAAFSAASHHVYFGDNLDEVKAADSSDTTGIYRSVQTSTTYTPGPLEFEKTYYWRIDEIEADGTTIHPGEVWSFTTKCFIPITDVSLIGWWKFDEGSGAIAFDWSGHDNDGILVGDPQWVTGKIDGALRFDGDNDYVDCGYDPSLNITQEVTVAAWIKLSEPGLDQKVASNQSGIAGGYKMTVWNNNKVEFEIRTSGNIYILNRNISGGTVLQPWVWYHVAGVYSQEGNYIRTYVNGVMDREMSTTEVLGASAGSLKIGCEPFDIGLYNFNGVMDDVRIYNRALTEAEIYSFVVPP